LSHFLQLILAVIEHIIKKAQSKGGILVFLPGVAEIRDCVHHLKDRYAHERKDVSIFPLHANLSNDEQRVVFRSVPGWKIVVATNVAEVRPAFSLS
jgi:ATP-dependent RNA helicase DHX57